MLSTLQDLPAFHAGYLWSVLPTRVGLVLNLMSAVTRFYDDDLSKQAFHCEGCGICRVGGRESYFHCEKCVACLPLNMRNKHKCIEESLQVDCPVVRQCWPV